MYRILVLRGGALGDLIVTLPALAALRERWPDALIELVGNATAGELARTAKLVDVVHSQQAAKWAKLYDQEDMPHEFQQWLASFDLVVNFWPDPAGELARRFPVRSGQTFVCGTAMPQIAPAAAHYRDALAVVGASSEQNAFDLSPFFRPREQEKTVHGHYAGLQEISRPRIAIHAGSGSSKKNWPVSRWTEVTRWLRDEHEAELVIVSGQAESIDALGAFGFSARNLPLDDLAKTLRSCRLFIGHDSGVSHLAAALSMECVLLFGPTDPAVWAPPQSWVRVIKMGEQLDAIAVAQVMAAVDAVLSDRR